MQSTIEKHPEKTLPPGFEQLAQRVERAETLARTEGSEALRADIAKETIVKYQQEIEGSPAAQAAEVHADAQQIIGHQPEERLAKLISLSQEKGVEHALSVLGKLKSWHKEDDFHAYLVTLITRGSKAPGLRAGSQIYQALNMSLFEIVLPKEVEPEKEQFSELVKTMEQFYAGLLSLEGQRSEKLNHIVLELANPIGQERVKIFVSIPKTRIDLFTRQLLAIFPKAKMVEMPNDYNVFLNVGHTIGSVAKLDSKPEFPLKTFADFGSDPMNVLINGFSKIPKDGGGACIQVVFKPVGKYYTDKFTKILKKLEEGESAGSDNVIIKILKHFGDALTVSTTKPEDGTLPKTPTVDTAAVEAVKKKLESPIVETNIRLVVSTHSETDSENLMHNFESAFNQFGNPGRQQITWKRVKESVFSRLKETDFYKSFIFRTHKQNEVLPLSLAELSTIIHFHTKTLSHSSNLDQSKARSAPAPLDSPQEGTLIGINAYQGIEKKIYIAPEDRLRHIYAVGQTGTGKSSLLKNLVIDDIEKGQGVCFIDPHGSDIHDILSQVPEHRLEDVIYFDPSATARPMALNMLEYDPNYPEQKTFVVNELFSIFKKLYSGSPESMGPMFEQYFRNATMLVIEDPETGCTLLDVSRVMADQKFRDLKISRCKNPVVIQFWKEVAEKAGGEASLANMVPYITSKFDVFLANDIMRPIVAQEKSAFHFREVMDSQKILLVNLSKGRLGDINAHLIGLILVGKILMAALSRVDMIGKDFPPFYLYIDEFQNITTNSIATILSEARKYKLSLTIAHQFIAQLQDEIKNAVFGNVGTICAMRVGQDDAEYLEKQFEPTFTAKDLASVDNFNGYIKTLVNGKPVDPFDFRLLPPRVADASFVEAVKEASFQKYGRDRDEIQLEIDNKYKKLGATPEVSPFMESAVASQSQNPAIPTSTTPLGANITKPVGKQSPAQSLQQLFGQ